MTQTLLALFSVIVVGMLALAAGLHLLKRLGPGGRVLAAACCRAPGLDLVVFLFTTAPLLAGLVVGARAGGTILWSLGGLAVAICAQIVGLLLWIAAHEATHRPASPRPRIITTMNRKVGPVRNAIAVWWTAWATPVFTLIRIAEITVYPPLIYLVGFPRYKHGEWVNVSRQKFDGLVGYDLIWCLYCDWMTGVWSLGGEMLRNVETFWCPIRFASPEKCANCSVDFPDIDGGWVPADGSIEDATALLDERYPGPGVNAWFGHPARLTVSAARKAEDSEVASD